ncbi:MAG: sortase [Lachnospiraceae bacterium]|nr:sortase [Lachnospiraceae bacterium]
MLRFYKKKRFNVAKLCFYVCLSMFIGSTLYLGNYFWGNHSNKVKQDKINDLMKNVEAEVDENGNIVDRYASIRDDYKDLTARLTYKYYKKAMLLPVMQTKDNDYYLYRDVEGKDSKAGTPFIDYRCDVKNSMILMIYAHNMRDLSQFGATKEYRNESYWKKYKTITFETMYEEPKEYQVFAAFYSRVYGPKDKDKFRYYNYFSLDTEEEYDEYVSNVKKLAKYDTGITPKFGQRLIVLSTCDYTQGYDTGRFAVVACETEVQADIEDLSSDEFKTTKEPEITEKPDDDDDSNNSSTKTTAPKSSSKPSKTTEPKATAKATAKAKETDKPQATAKATAKAKETEKPDDIDETKSPVITAEPEKTQEPTEKPVEKTTEPEPTKEPVVTEKPDDPVEPDEGTD